MSVPILDEAYMKRRAHERYVESYLSYNPFRRTDTEATLREEYALGKLTFAQFERRLERLLGCT